MPDPYAGLDDVDEFKDHRTVEERIKEAYDGYIRAVNDRNEELRRINKHKNKPEPES